MTKGHLIGTGRTAEIFAWDDDRVLKLFRDWCPHSWVDQEARVSRVVYEAGLPVPAIDGIVGVDGRRGIIFERIEGTSMADLIMDAMASTRDGHLQYAEMLAELHASIHSREGHDLPSLRAMVEGGIRQATTLSDELRMRALHVLDQIRDGTGLCHYDFHPLNVIVSPRGPVIIDWMTASPRDPHADIARTLLLLRSAQAPQTLIDRFIACYLTCYSEK